VYLLFYSLFLTIDVLLHLLVQLHHLFIMLPAVPVAMAATNIISRNRYRYNDALYSKFFRATAA